MNKNHFSEDILEFLQILNKHQVRYLITGGEAVIYYGYPRLTGDIDIFYSLDNENVESLFKALLLFWDNDIPGIDTSSVLSRPGQVIQFGVAPNRLDLINSIDGVEFDDAWKNRTREEIQKEDTVIPIWYIGLNELVENKKASGREKDLDDLEYLQSIKK